LSKKLGSYIVNLADNINPAIEKQIEANKEGRRVKSIGEILLEMEVITQKDLETAVRLQRMDRLASCPIFSSLPNADLALMSNHFTEVSIPPGEQFIKQGENDPVLYVIADGRVQVSTINKFGSEITIAELGEGEPIGEMGYFSGEARTASVRALEQVQLLRAEYGDLSNCFEKAVSAALVFMQFVNQRQIELEQMKKQTEFDPFAKLTRD